MEQFNDLAIVLKTYPYQERDRIVVCLTENHGRITAVAKGGTSSRRFGGALDFLACSKVSVIQKPNAELGRIDGAVIHHEFSNLALDFERLTAASFVAEFCLRLLESHSPTREMFVLLSNAVYQINSGMPLFLAINTFLCKSFKFMGFAPSLLRCVQCSRGAHEILESYSGQKHGHSQLFYWYSEAGGMICCECAQGRFKLLLAPETLLFFQKLTVTPFKELSSETIDIKSHELLYRLLSDFLHHHIPGLPQGGLKSWKHLNDVLFSCAF